MPPRFLRKFDVADHDPVMASRQYQEFRDWLKHELDIEPMPETQALYDHIRLELNAGKSRIATELTDIQEKDSQRASFNALLGAIERSRREVYEALSSQFP